MVTCIQNQIQGREFISRVTICSCLPEAISIYIPGPDINSESAFFCSQRCPGSANKLYDHISYNQCRTIKSNVVF